VSGEKGRDAEPLRALLGRPQTRPPLLAVVHLPPSLSYAACPGVDAAVRALCEDVRMLDASGVDGILLENDADKPHTLTVNKAQVAWLTRLSTEARRQTALPLGIGVQRIDWEAALAVACAASMQFVRLDVFVDRVRMLGEEVCVSPPEVRALRSALRADAVEIWADVHVKHADLLSEGSLAQSARRAVDEGARAVSITGRRTGEPPTVADLDTARAAAGPAAVVIGSGLTPDNAASLAPHADGAMVGTSLMQSGRVVRSRVEAMVKGWHRACESQP